MRLRCDALVTRTTMTNRNITAFGCQNVLWFVFIIRRMFFGIFQQIIQVLQIHGHIRIGMLLLASYIGVRNAQVEIQRVFVGCTMVAEKTELTAI